MRRSAGIGCLVVALALAITGSTLAQETPAGKASTAPGRTIAFKQEEDLATQLARVGAGLAIALLVGAVALVGYKRLIWTQGGGRRMRLIETLRLGPKASLFLVEVDGKTLLIGQYGESLAVLERPPRQDEI